jgi:hypothetical protein
VVPSMGPPKPPTAAVAMSYPAGAQQQLGRGPLPGSPASALAAAAALASRRQLRGNVCGGSSSSTGMEHAQQQQQQQRGEKQLGAMLPAQQLEDLGQVGESGNLMGIDGGCDTAGRGKRANGGVTPPAGSGDPQSACKPPAGPARQSCGTTVIPAVGAWAAAAEQLRGHGVAGVAGGRGSQGLGQNPPCAFVHGDANGITMAGSRKTAACGVLKSKGAPAATPGAVRPRGGMGRAAVGPLLKMLRAEAGGLAGGSSMAK